MQVIAPAPAPPHVPAGTYVCRPWCSSHDDGTLDGALRSVPNPADQACYHAEQVAGTEIGMSHSLAEGTLLDWPYAEGLTPAEAEQFAFQLLAMVASVRSVVTQ